MEEEKLKTLREIEGFIGFCHKGHVTKRKAAELMADTRDELKREFRAEAVKWVKFFLDREMYEKAEAIAEFFNLTEEDLG